MFDIILPLYTLTAFFSFLGICAWACSTARQPAFAEAEQLPFTDPEEQALRRKALILGR